MPASVFSDRWYRVIDLRPRLRPNVRVNRQLIRDETWFLLSSGGKSKTHRLNASAWSFVGRCDGDRTVQQTWDVLLAASREDMPTQGEIVLLLTQLYKAGLIEFDQSPDVELMIKQTRKEQRSEMVQRANPLSFRVPLGDPTRWLRKCNRLSATIYSPAGLLVWSMLLLAGVALTLINWDELARHAGKWLATPRYVVIAWLVYPFIKFVHEMGHALAVIRWGGLVREAGIGMFMLLPMPYVDASDSNLFAQRYQRALVSAAGIMAELAVAVVGLIVWALTQPGLIQDIGFTFAFVGGVSTLLFNANPLMRLDGYYLLCDLTQLPNMAQRSTRHLQTSFLRSVLRVKDVVALAPARGEGLWLLIYSPLSWMYRAVVVVWLLLWAGSYHPLLGVVVGGFAILMMIVLPIVIGSRQMLMQIPAGRSSRGAHLRLALAGTAVLGMLVVIPLPHRSVAQGIVWLPEQGQVRAQVDGFLVAMDTSNNTARPGDQVIRLDDPAVEIELRKLMARREGLQTSVYQTLATDAFKSKQFNEEIVSIDRRIKDILERRAQLEVRAALPGRFTVKRAGDMDGQFFKQGETIGYMIGSETPVVRVAVHQEEAAFLTSDVKEISIRLAQLPGQELRGRMVRSTPSAIDRLPSAALGDRAGGDVIVDPNDKDGTRTVEPTYVIDVQAERIPTDLIGGRAWVRFDYGWASAATQGFRHFRQLILMHFSPLES